jgi:hypothetical protein
MTPKEKEICVQWWTDRMKIEDKREIFKTALCKRLHDNMMLYVDYDPTKPLLEALHEAGIKCQGVFFSHKGIFPSNIGMNIRCHDDTIRVKDGYGEDWEVLRITSDDN